MSKMNLILLALSAALTAACVTQPTSLDPVGTWSMTHAYTDGSCSVTGSAMNTLTVSEAGQATYLINDSDPSVTSVSGQMECTDTSCRMKLHETARVVSNGVSVDIVLDASLTVDDTDDINGAGSMTAHNLNTGGTCVQNFRSRGSRR